jgi:hypothetical protein
MVAGRRSPKQKVVGGGATRLKTVPLAIAREALRIARSPTSVMSPSMTFGQAHTFI